ncbi:hypothetical protein F8388_010777 [Cannabis sativa]|uniref:Uncharacterized protein n=1 Tax=Cannabis sativa TaxID=3483 RepID=A0A7J6E4V5_CANSA|nr:hypothetical protein G4B88_020179 [Cannabis sativa]KAF4392754.1 hypothetical protein F8388_010777 [Cannabis sativa]
MPMFFLTPLAYVLYADKAYLFYEYSSKGTLFSSGMCFGLGNSIRYSIAVGVAQEALIFFMGFPLVQSSFIYQAGDDRNSRSVSTIDGSVDIELWSNSAGTANSNSKTAVNMLDFSNQFSRTSFSTTNQMLADLKVFY